MSENTFTSGIKEGYYKNPGKTKREKSNTSGRSAGNEFRNGRRRVIRVGEKMEERAPKKLRRQGKYLLSDCKEEELSYLN